MMIAAGRRCSAARSHCVGAYRLVLVIRRFAGVRDGRRRPVGPLNLGYSGIDLGFPPYFGYIIVAWKIPCALALLAPRFPRAKEWAYAGAIFNYTGAVVSWFLRGDGPKRWPFHSCSQRSLWVHGRCAPRPVALAKPYRSSNLTL